GVFGGGGAWGGSPGDKAGGGGFDTGATGEALGVGGPAFTRELGELDKPTAAAVNGVAVGPGAPLALACDFVLVHPATRFLWSFHRWGLVVDAGGAYLLPRPLRLPRAQAGGMVGPRGPGARGSGCGPG